MTSDEKKSRKSSLEIGRPGSGMRAVAIAAIAVLAVGAAAIALAVMMVGGRYGEVVHSTNSADDKTANLNGQPGSSQCALDATALSSVKKASTGELAAFAAMDRPYSVSRFKFVDADGSPKTLADWQGRTVLVNLWATWCAPCRAEMPYLDALQQKLGSAEFEVMPISVDQSDPSKPKAFFQDISVKSMKFYHDEQAMTLNMLKRDGLALGLPATLLVDGRGCVLGRINGPAEWASDDATNLIKSAL